MNLLQRLTLNPQFRINTTEALANACTHIPVDTMINRILFVLLKKYVTKYYTDLLTLKQLH